MRHPAVGGQPATQHEVGIGPLCGQHAEKGDRLREAGGAGRQVAGGTTYRSDGPLPGLRGLRGAVSEEDGKAERALHAQPRQQRVNEKKRDGGVYVEAEGRAPHPRQLIHSQGGSVRRRAVPPSVSQGRPAA